MNKTITRFHLLYLFLFLFNSIQLLAQNNYSYNNLGTNSKAGLNYTVANPAGVTYSLGVTTPMTSAITIAGSAGAVNQLYGPYAISGILPYDGMRMTQFWISSNGFIAFRNPGSSLPVNNMDTGFCIVAPLWDEIVPTGGVRVLNNLGPLYIEWRGVKWGPAASSGCMNFCVKVDKTTGLISFYYDRPCAIFDNPSASIGLTGHCPNDFLNTTSAGVAAANFSKLTSFENYITSLTNGLAVTFTPASQNNNTCASAINVPLNANATSTIRGSFISSDTIGAYNGTCLIDNNVLPNRFHDQWYTFSKPTGITSFEVFVDSNCIGTTGLTLYRGNSCGSWTEVGCLSNTDAINGGPINITGRPCAAEQYYVQVESDGSDSIGIFRLNIRPPGRNCAAATVIDPACVTPTYTSPTLTNCGFIGEVDSASSACKNSFNRGEDYVFQFTPTTTFCANLSVTATNAATFPALFVYNGCPTAGGTACLGVVTGNGGAALNFNNITLTAGITYYFLIDHDSANSAPCTPFIFSLTNTAGLPPAIDDCAAAETLTVITAATCTGALNKSNSCATPSALGTVPVPSCGSFTDGLTPDVWFRFQSGAVITTPYLIKVDLGTTGAAQDLVAVVYSGSCAGPLTEVACDDNSNGSGMPAATFLPTASTWYFVRIFSNNGTEPGNFRICVLSGCAPPNDQPCSAILLPLTVTTSGTNVCSSGAGEPAGGTCFLPAGTNVLHTVWYRFVAPTGGNVKIKTRLNTLTDSQIALYQGACGSLTQVSPTSQSCNNNSQGACNTGAYTYRESEINITGLIPGNTYYISVDGVGTATGTFDITVMNNADPILPITGQDCALATPVCSQITTVPDPGFNGTGNICDLIPPASPSCFFGGEKGASWYTFSMSGPGNLQFSINPNGVYDYDFFLWRIDTVSNYCNRLNDVASFPYTACHWIDTYGGTGLQGPAFSAVSQSGSAFGPAYFPMYPVTGGETFLLMVSDWSNNSTVGYSIDFGTTPLTVNPSTLYWQSASNTDFNDGNNWLPNCNAALPGCGTGVASAVITSIGAISPVITGTKTVKDLTINPGGTLTIATGATLEICGNLTNYGSFICQPNSTVKFIGNTAQAVTGTFNTANQFHHVIVDKTANAVKLNTNVVIGGNYDIIAGAVNNNNKSTFLAGNFSNFNGAASYTGLGTGLGGSTLVLNGAANQNFINLGATLTLNNVNINQSVTSSVILGAGAFNDLNLNNAAVLTLTNGKIVTGARRVYLANNATTACNPGSTISYVEGNLRREIPAFPIATTRVYDLPVGNAALGYQRISLAYEDGPATPYYVDASFNSWAGLPPNGPVALECLFADWSVNPTFDHGYWTINASATSAQDTFEVRAYPLGYTNNIGGPPNAYSIMKREGAGPWTMQGECIYPGTGLAPVSRGKLVNFSDFGITQFGSPLPITLLYFDANRYGDGAICQWSTASEINNDYFEVWRSYNGNDFEKIGTVAGFGPGNSPGNLNYSFIDVEQCDAIQYYQLKQVDIDGRFQFSNVVALNCSANDKAINLVPNPTSYKINISIQPKIVNGASIAVKDMYGKTVFLQKLNPEAINNLITLDVSQWASGIYNVELQSFDGETRSTARFVKQ